MNWKRVEVVWGRICFSLLLTVLLLFGVELASRTFMSSRTPFELLYPGDVYRHPRPYDVFSGVPNLGDLNARGYKGPSPVYPKPAGEYRILFLGGSTIVEGDPTLCELVEKELQATAPAVRVYNLGVISGCSGMELAKLVFEAADLQPDLIVMYNGANDILDRFLADPRPGYPFNYVIYEKNVLLESRVEDYPLFTLMAYGSNLLRARFPDYFLDRLGSLRAAREVSGYGTEPWKDQIARAYMSHVIKAAKISQTFGAECVIFFQPTLYYKNVLSPEEQAFCRADEKAYALDVRQRVRREADLARRQSGFGVVDLSDVYATDTVTRYVDPIHTRQDAKPVMAAAMARHLAPLVAKRLARSQSGPRHAQCF